MQWGNSNTLYLLILIPLLSLTVFFLSYRQKRRFEKFSDKKFFSFYLGEYSLFYSILRAILILFAMIFLIVSSARPQWGKDVQLVRKEGLDIAICIDVSKSMEADDIKPNRLQRAKDQIALFIDKLKGDRVAIIPFAGESFIQLPLTDDYNAAKMFLNLLDTNTVPVAGTNIGSALETAMSAFVEPGRNRIIILISDGEDLEDRGVEVAKKAAESGIIIYALGVGSREGSPIPVKNAQGNLEYAKDRSGNIIISKLDVDVLNMIAHSGNGKFYLVTPHQSEIFEILRAIESMEREKYDAQEYVHFVERYRYFLLTALILLLIEALIVNKRKVKDYNLD